MSVMIVFVYGFFDDCCVWDDVVVWFDCVFIL